jgi:polyphosphate glucokinase
VPAAPKPANRRVRRILCIDIGGTGLKAAVIATTGRYLTERVRIKTPKHRKPRHIVAALTELIEPLGAFDAVTVGFPGMVRKGKVLSTPHFGTRDWHGFAMEAALRKAWRKPVKLLNDADVQGLAVIKGKGVEMVCTLGTGFGTALFHDGALLPHMDLSHLAVHRKGDLDVYAGDKARRKLGEHHWNRRIEKLVGVFKTVFAYDHLYLGGGNSRCVAFKLPRNVRIVSNDAGMEGGAYAWKLGIDTSKS